MGRSNSTRADGNKLLCLAGRPGFSGGYDYVLDCQKLGGGHRFLSRLPHEAWLHICQVAFTSLMKLPSAEPLQGPSSCHVSLSWCMLLLDT